MRRAKEYATQQRRLGDARHAQHQEMMEYLLDRAAVLMEDGELMEREWGQICPIEHACFASFVDLRPFLDGADFTGWPDSADLGVHSSNKGAASAAKRGEPFPAMGRWRGGEWDILSLGGERGGFYECAEAMGLT
jgi:hypothetical protein